MVESMMQTSYPAFSRGVEMARIPKGAVASMLENEATKKTIFLEDATALSSSQMLLSQTLLIAMRREIVSIPSNSCKHFFYNRRIDNSVTYLSRVVFYTRIIEDSQFHICSAASRQKVLFSPIAASLRQQSSGEEISEKKSQSCPVLPSLWRAPPRSSPLPPQLSLASIASRI